MSFRMLSAASMLLMLTASLADTASAGEKRWDPADPNAAVAPQRYVSDFSSYRKPQFEQTLDWRRANDIVRDVGGHAGALKDAEEPSAAAPTVPAPGKPGMHHGEHSGHSGHGGHGGHRQ